MVSRGLMKGKTLSPAEAGFNIFGTRYPGLKAWATLNRPLTRTEAPSLTVGLLPRLKQSAFTEPRPVGSGIKIQVELLPCWLSLSVLSRVAQSSPFHVIALQKLFHLFAIVHHRRKQRLVVLLALEFQNVARAAGADQVFERLPFEHDDDQVHI